MKFRAQVHRARRQKAHHVCFCNFTKARFVVIVSAQINVEYLQMLKMYYSYLCEQKWGSILGASDRTGTSICPAVSYCSAPHSSVTNPVHGLPLTHHQRSLAHHMDSCTTLTVALHLRLQFPSSIALTIHTADCTDHTPYINHGLPFPLGRVLYSLYPSDSYPMEPSKLL